MAPTIMVRPPVAGDGPAMGRTHVRAWQVGYRHLMPADFLDGLDAEQRGEVWEQRIGSGNPDGSDRHGLTRTIVGLVDGEILGLCTYGSYRPVVGIDPEADPDKTADHEAAALGVASPHSELWALNVHPEAWGTGLAQAVMAETLTGLAAHPQPQAVLWVLEGNHRARRFYHKTGWGPDGVQQTVDIGGVSLAELRYVVDLSPHRPPA